MSNWTAIQHGRKSVSLILYALAYKKNKNNRLQSHKCWPSDATEFDSGKCANKATGLK